MLASLYSSWLFYLLNKYIYHRLRQRKENNFGFFWLELLHLIRKMPPKKKEEPVKTVLMGRMGSNLKIGIVGLPNVGYITVFHSIPIVLTFLFYFSKSTFFNCLTKSQANAENFPFCTIDPNESRCPVPDDRFDYLCKVHKPAKETPAFLNVVDIAGLVQGAHEGKGLGNAFLSNINACDAIFHMVRIFEDEDVVHVEGDVNPTRDLQIIYDELMFKDIEILDKYIDPIERAVTRNNDKSKKFEYEVLSKVRKILKEDKKWVKTGTFDPKEVEILNERLFLTAKPVIYLINMTEKDYKRKKNKWLPKIKEWVDKNDAGAMMIPFSADLELKLMDMPDDERQRYLDENEMTSSLAKIVVNGYKALNLEYFFTAGPDEVRAWTIQKGTKAQQAAGRIHSDMEKGFIMAEVMKFSDFKEAGSEAACKAAGKYMQKGRDYMVEDADIIFFKFNTPSSGKK